VYVHINDIHDICIHIYLVKLQTLNEVHQDIEETLEMDEETWEKINQKEVYSCIYKNRDNNLLK
jgi:hypothetical protein